MTILKLNKAPKTSFPSIGKGRLLGFLFFLFSQICFSQLNNDKKEFDLNDPRNPNCPCHKYQKMADNEFINLNKKNNSNQSEKTFDQGSNQNLQIRKTKLEKTKSLPDHRQIVFTKTQKRKLFKSRRRKYFNYFTLKSSKIQKFKPDYTVCYKW